MLNERRNSFKKLFYRFLKEHNIFAFITHEIAKEWPNIDNFIDYVLSSGRTENIFNSKRVLTFEWKIKGCDTMAGIFFWNRIHRNWVKYCADNEIEL